MLANMDQRRGSAGMGNGRTSPQGHSHSKGAGVGGGAAAAAGVGRSSTHPLVHYAHPGGNGGGHNDGERAGQETSSLPTLWQVLHRKTLPPVCLYNFYLYMRDYERSSEQVDFWLDVTTHEVLWRLYVRTLRRKEARERAEERQLAREREERDQRAAAVAAAADQWQSDQEEASQAQPMHKSHKSQSSMSLEMIKPHWTVAKRFLDMSQEERQEYGEQTGLRWEDVKDVMLERAQLEEARAQVENNGRPQPRQEEYLLGTEADNDIEQMGSFNILQELDGGARTTKRASPPLQSSQVQQQQQQQQQHQVEATREGRVMRDLQSKSSLEPILLADAPRDHRSQQHLQQSTSSPTSRSVEFLPTQEPSHNRLQKMRAQSPAGESSPSLSSSAAGAGATATAAVSISPSQSPSPHRGSSKGLSGMAVSREEVVRSAERIYLKYLTPQAERHVHIPPSVRQRIAVFMDGYLMNNQPSSSPPSSSSSSSPSRTEQRSGDAGIAAGKGEQSERGNGASTDEVRPSTRSTTKTSTPSPTPATPEKKGVVSKSSSHGKGSETDPSNEKQSRETAAATRSKSSTFSNPKATMRASTINQGLGRPNSSKGSFHHQQPQPDQELGLVFSEARDVVFNTMERYYFPRFLRARAYGNMVHTHRVFRLLLGLFFLFLGFTTVFCLIFLNAQPRSKRAWALIPMFLGVVLCTTFQFNLCPVLAAFNVSETKWMQFSKNKEAYIIRLHRWRALKVVVIAILYTVCLSLVFGFLPGHRL
ncbi:Bud site selection protein, Revert to axial protein 1 [Actinomortierella ambigua]|nr:Bud site selection protein, Revert to axial protein 1 [Actinomortierella ambigua]